MIDNNNLSIIKNENITAPAQNANIYLHYLSNNVMNVQGFDIRYSAVSPDRKPAFNADCSNMFNMMISLNMDLESYLSMADISRVKNMAYMCNGCKNIIGNIALPLTVENLAYAFYYCHGIQYINGRYVKGSSYLSSELPYADNMAYAFEYCFNLYNSVSGPNVTNMYHAFSNTAVKYFRCGDKVTNFSNAYYNVKMGKPRGSMNDVIPTFEGRIAQVGNNVINATNAFANTAGLFVLDFSPSITHSVNMYRNSSWDGNEYGEILMLNGLQGSNLLNGYAAFYGCPINHSIVVSSPTLDNAASMFYCTGQKSMIRERGRTLWLNTPNLRNMALITGSASYDLSNNRSLYIVLQNYNRGYDNWSYTNQNSALMGCLSGYANASQANRILVVPDENLFNTIYNNISIVIGASFAIQFYEYNTPYTVNIPFYDYKGNFVGDIPLNTTRRIVRQSSTALVPYAVFYCPDLANTTYTFPINNIMCNYEFYEYTETYNGYAQS